MIALIRPAAYDSNGPRQLLCFYKSRPRPVNYYMVVVCRMVGCIFQQYASQFQICPCGFPICGASTGSYWWPASDVVPPLTADKSVLRRADLGQSHCASMTGSYCIPKLYSSSCREGCVCAISNGDPNGTRARQRPGFYTHI